MPQDLQWGPVPIERKQGTEHFLVVGASGSGKTTLLKMLMRSVFESEYEFTGLIYDPKQELLPILYQLRDETEHHVKKGTASIRVLNPFDWRCCSWELSKDITSPVSAKQLAAILVPESEGSAGGDQFFTHAVRDLLSGVMLSFINCAKADCKWTLRDLLLGVLYEPYLRAILGVTKTRDNKPFPIVHRLRKTYLDSQDQRTVSNILATISAKLSIYEPVAAAWHNAEEDEDKGAKFQFSLDEWSKGTFSDILVMGNDESGRAAIDPINRAIFKRASELILSRTETTDEEKATGERQTWFVLDEVREAGKLDGLGSLMTKGRSKGACIVLSFQDIEGMRSVYGNEVANELCGQCTNSIVLRLNSPSTAQWASELFGKYLGEGENSGIQSGGVSAGLTQQEMPYLYTSDFAYLPSAGLDKGVTGFLRDPELNPKARNPKWHLTGNQIRQLSPPKAESTGYLSAFMPLPDDSFYLKPWDAADWRRLGFGGVLPNWEEETVPPPNMDDAPMDTDIPIFHVRD